MITFTTLCMLVLLVSINLANSDYVWLEREQINGNGRCRYLTRWHLFRWKDRLSIYLHCFQGDDWSLDRHDHPKAFTSIGIWGSYVEETDNGLQLFIAPWIRRFPATHRHRLMLLPLFAAPERKRSCWTIVIVGKPVRDWGWWIPRSLWGHFNGVHDIQPGPSGEDIGWVDWQTYVHNHDVADARKSCP